MTGLALIAKVGAVHSYSNIDLRSASPSMYVTIYASSKSASAVLATTPV